MSRLSVGKLSKAERWQRSVDAAFEVGKDLGAEDERVKIVAWLRKPAPLGVRGHLNTMELADLIERGAHDGAEGGEG